MRRIESANRFKTRPLSRWLPRGCYTFWVRKLIVNADDFGLTTGVNRAIVETHTSGVVSSATLMANGPAFDDAVAGRASRRQVFPWDAMSCWWMERPCRRPERWIRCWRFARPSRTSSIPAFRPLPRAPCWEASIAINWSRKSPRKSRKIQAAGLQVTHLDTHKHAHIFPEILAALLRAARICGVRAIRNPFVPMKAMPARQFKSKRDLWKRYGQVRVLHTFLRTIPHSTKRAGLLTPDGVIGVIETGSGVQL